MVDSLTKDERSTRMARIRSKDTKPELLIRKAIWAAGHRYRLHVPGLPGKPDLVFPSLGVAMFVNGCFWHGHVCQKGRIPGGNSEFWRKKFEVNKARDRSNVAELECMGWRVATIWECSLSTIARKERELTKILDFLGRAGHDEYRTSPGLSRGRVSRF